MGPGEATLCCLWCGILVTMCRAPEAPVPLDPARAVQMQHRTLSLNVVPTGGCPRLRGTASLPQKVQT